MIHWRPAALFAATGFLLVVLVTFALYLATVPGYERPVWLSRTNRSGRAVA